MGLLGALTLDMFREEHKLGLLGFKSKYVELTAAEILALNATPKTLVPAPGRGKALVFDHALVELIPGTAEYVSQAGSTPAAITNRIVASVNLTDVALTIANQPLSPSYITFTITDTTPSITAGTLTLVGLDRNGNVQSEVANVAKTGLTWRSRKVYSYVHSATTAGFTVLGGGGDETIVVGTEPVSAEDFGIYYGTLASGRRVGVLHSQGFLRDAEAFDDDSVVTVVDLTNVALTLTAEAAALPAPANLVVTIVDTTPSITAGEIYIAGTAEDGTAISEIITFVSGTLVYVSQKTYATVTQVKTVGFTTLGGSSDETIKVGTTAGAKIAYVLPEERTFNVPENTALVLAMDIGEVASGNGTMRVRVFYREIAVKIRKP